MGSLGLLKLWNELFASESPTCLLASSTMVFASPAG